MSDYIKKKEKKSELGPLGRRKARGKEGKMEGFPSMQILVIGEDGKQKMGTFDADGKIQFRKGGRVCKLAKKGKGRAYGKNS